MVADVTTEEGCRLAVSDEPGLAPDGLVLNVGTGFHGMGVAGTSIDDWDRTFDLDLQGAFHAGPPRPGNLVRERTR